MRSKTVLLLGANSDVAKQAILLYLEKGYQVIAASRSTADIASFLAARNIPAGAAPGSAATTNSPAPPNSAATLSSTVPPSSAVPATSAVTILYFDATAFSEHAAFYASLPAQPHIVVYAAGFQVTNEQALIDWEGTYRMMNVMYAGAVSILNIIASDVTNTQLERIIGLSSLSGVRGRKSNFIYGSTKAAFTQYLAGLRQHLADRKIIVNAIVAGYIRSKMTAGLDLPESLLMEPAFIARAIVDAGSGRTIVPGFKWKIIYRILKALPESLVARLP